MDLVNLVATNVVLFNNRTLDFDVENSQAFLAEEMMVGRGHTVIVKFSPRDRYCRNQVLFNKRVQCVVHCGH